MSSWVSFVWSSVFPYCHHTTKTLNDLDSRLEEQWNRCVGPPPTLVDVSLWRDNKQTAEMPLTMALSWHPTHLAKIHGPIPSHVHHHHFIDVWKKGLDHPQCPPIEQAADCFTQSLKIWQDAGYDFGDCQINGRRRLSFLHSLLWLVGDKYAADVLFRHCLEIGLPVSQDLLNDVKYVQENEPLLAQQIERYVLTQHVNSVAPPPRRAKI